jgi:acylphosphatase
MRSLRIVLFGTVQKIGFRRTLLKIAKEKKLSGFAKNLPDGSIEICLKDETVDVNQLIEEAKSLNPRLIISDMVVEKIDLLKMDEFLVF